MPVLMEKKDWMQAVANVSAAENVWYENISSDYDTVPLPLPGRGSYQVILVKLGMPQNTVAKSPVRIGLMQGKWTAPSDEADKMMDEEISAAFDVDGDIS